MARRARLKLAEVPQHVIQRGHNRTACFFADDDYSFYLYHLGQLAARWQCCVHAYALMTNHVHLLLTASSADGTSLLMKHLAQRYVEYVNRVYRRSGTLWQGRFKSSPVQRQGYLLMCQRYIELNPVRAGMVRHPREYRWSSYRTNGDLARSALLTPHEEYLSLGATSAERAAQYRRMFQFELAATELNEIRSAANGGFALGNDRFRAEIAAALGRRVERLRNRLSS